MIGPCSWCHPENSPVTGHVSLQEAAPSMLQEGFLRLTKAADWVVGVGEPPTSAPLEVDQVGRQAWPPQPSTDLEVLVILTQIWCDFRLVESCNPLLALYIGECCLIL